MSEDSNGGGEDSDADRDPIVDPDHDSDDPLADRDPIADANRDSDEDPFERIGEGTGPRHGDPFDSFQESGPGAEAGAEDAGADDAATSGSAAGESPAAERPDPARDGLPSGLEADADAEDPFTEFDEPTTDPFAEGESVFEGASAAQVGDDGVWERMESTDAEAEAVPGKQYVDVNKHSYCETCEYFSEPPEIACSHEGTEILEFVDMETVRVANCPIVAERKALEGDE